MRKIILMVLLSVFNLNFYAQNLCVENSYVSDTIPNYVNTSLSKDEIEVVQEIVRNFKWVDYSTIASLCIHPEWKNGYFKELKQCVNIIETMRKKYQISEFIFPFPPVIGNMKLISVSPIQNTDNYVVKYLVWDDMEDHSIKLYLDLLVSKNKKNITLKHGDIKVESNIGRASFVSRYSEPMLLLYDDKTRAIWGMLNGDIHVTKERGSMGISTRSILTIKTDW